jgi:hypothetical protein
MITFDIVFRRLTMEAFWKLRVALTKPSVAAAVRQLMICITGRVEIDKVQVPLQTNTIRKERKLCFEF